MTDHPSTYSAEDTYRPGIDWDDRAALHRVDDGGGVLDAGKGLRSGTFAELVRHVMALPEDERDKYYIQKAGDSEYHTADIVKLASHPNFPHGK